MTKVLTYPTTKNSRMAHTAVLTEVKSKINKIARAQGVHQNVIFNTLLTEGLKQRRDLMAKAYTTKKKVTKKVTRKK